MGLKEEMEKNEELMRKVKEAEKKADVNHAEKDEAERKRLEEKEKREETENKNAEEMKKVQAYMERMDAQQMKIEELERLNEKRRLEITGLQGRLFPPSPGKDNNSAVQPVAQMVRLTHTPAKGGEWCDYCECTINSVHFACCRIRSHWTVQRL